MLLPQDQIKDDQEKVLKHTPDLLLFSGSYFFKTTMASDYHYHHNHQSSSNSDQSPPPPLPLHLCFFLSILFLFLGLSWYMSYESAVESLFDQIKMTAMLLPVVLLLVFHVLSDSRWMPFVVQSPAVGSPWGVALVLVSLIFMVSYRNTFQERWFPFVGR